MICTSAASFDQDPDLQTLGPQNVAREMRNPPVTLSEYNLGSAQLLQQNYRVVFQE
jgi:hypothetical protein